MTSGYDDGNVAIVSESAKRKILIADDDALICDVIAVFLEDWPGTEVRCVSDGGQGARMLREHKFHLALIDATIPTISAIELAGIAAGENTPSLLMCGHPHVIDELERYGFAYLQKPFTLTRLLAEIQTMISNAGETVRRVREAMGRTQASIRAVKTPNAESHQPVVDPGETGG